MRVYSLTQNNNDFLGFEDDGTIIDLTRALSLYEITLKKNVRQSYRYLEELRG